MTDVSTHGGQQGLAPEPGTPLPGRRLPAPLRAVRQVLLSRYLVLLLTALYVLAILPFTTNLLSTGNLTNILSNYWPLLVVAVGQTFVLVVAGIDLSQTSIMAVANVAAAMIVTERLNPALFEKSAFWGWLLGPDGGPLPGAGGVPVAVLVAVLVGALIGLGNGLAVSRLGMPAFMVTLASYLFFAAFAVWATKSENVTGLPDAYAALGTGAVLGVPIPLLLAVGVAVVAHLLLARTVFGRYLYAVGANPRAATVSGVPRARVVTAAYVVSGVCASLGAILYSARLEAGRPTLGANLLLDVVGACVIGGVSLFGGKGNVLGAAMGVLLFVVLANGLNLLQLPFYTVMVVKGGVILVAVLLDVVRLRATGEGT
jgi:ribose transport system permease protein